LLVALERLLHRIDEAESFSMDVLPCSLVIRQSCGCSVEEGEAQREQNEAADFTNPIKALRTESNSNVEYNRDISHYHFKHVRDLSVLLENYFNWGAIMQQQGYNSMKEPKL